MIVKRKYAIESITKEFDMIRNWSNGFGYINSWYIWEKASMLGGTKNDSIWFVRFENKAVMTEPDMGCG